MTEPFAFRTSAEYLRVSFPKRKYSRGAAWQTLLKHHRTEGDNPWRKDHDGLNWKWYAPLSAFQKTPETPVEPAEVEFPDPKVWFQVSRKYRTVARLPEGMDGNEALVWGIQQHGVLFNDRVDRTEHQVVWARGLSSRSAAAHFLRVYTGYEFSKHLQQDLSREQFSAFRKAGGDCYHG